MAVGRRPGTPKTGGKIKGVSKNKPKPLILDDTPENRALVLAAPTTKVLTPKIAMMAALQYYYDLAQDMMRAQNQEGTNKAWSACLAVAKELAPFIHARLLAVESRGDFTDAQVPFVLRSPFVVENSAEWQAMASQQAAVLDKADREAVLEHLRYREATSGLTLPISGKSSLREQPPEAMPHPATPTPLRADQATSRITVMPPGPRVVQPSGTAEWLESIKKIG
jgi:hypothetical protein